MKIEQIVPQAPGGGTQRLYRETETGLQILLYDRAENGPHRGGRLSHDASRVRAHNGAFEYVVVDLPPLGPSTSARNISPMIDMFIFVVKWGTTPRGVVRAALQKERNIKSKLLGAISTTSPWTRSSDMSRWVLMTMTMAAIMALIRN